VGDRAAAARASGGARGRGDRRARRGVGRVAGRVRGVERGADVLGRRARRVRAAEAGRLQAAAALPLRRVAAAHADGEDPQARAEAARGASLMRVVLALLALTGSARADAFDLLAEGAPAYAAVRPVALIGALKRLGVDELPEVKRLKSQLGGLDPLDPALLAPSGPDVAAPLAGSLFETLPGGRVHHRVVATLRDKMLFAAFLMGLAGSGKVALEAVDASSPLGKLGVTTTAKLPGLVAILRLQGDTAIVDAFESKQPSAPLEIARKVPLQPKKPFVAEKGARRLFAP